MIGQCLLGVCLVCKVKNVFHTYIRSLMQGKLIMYRQQEKILQQ